MHMEDFAEGRVEGLAEEVRAQVDAEAVRARSLKTLGDYWAGLGPGGSRLEGYARRVPFPGVAPEAYAHRALRLPGGARILGGISFFGLDPARPFLNIKATTARLTEADLAAALGALGDAYPDFAPRTLRVWSGDLASPLPNAVVDQHLLVGTLPRSAGTAPRALPLGMVLSPDPALEAYAPLAQAFREMVSADAGRRPFLRFAEGPDLARCAKLGALRVAWLGGAPVGLIAASPGVLEGIAGWILEELFIVPAWQGRGLGKAMQGAFLRALSARSSGAHPGLVLGTIDGRNTPSRRSALANGRHVAGAWRFWPERP